jgi:hypothetical protein
MFNCRATTVALPAHPDVQLQASWAVGQRAHHQPVVHRQLLTRHLLPAARSQVTRQGKHRPVCQHMQDIVSFLLVIFCLQGAAM